jgi:hypothetical protein
VEERRRISVLTKHPLNEQKMPKTTTNSKYAKLP